MISGFLVKKGLMTSVYTPDGKRIAVTKCIAKPLKVTQIKTTDKDGYQSIQVAGGSKKRINKATTGKMVKLSLDIKPSFFKEFKLVSDQIPTIGDEIAIESVFNNGDIVDITGTSKGRGFAGVVKRHGFKKQPLLGASNYVRRPGSIGAQTPGKVVKGKKMPGHFGVDTVTVSSLEIISINPETKEILIKGSIPGSFNSWITLKKRN
ncbi:MAG: 50S ribosomal protein L3 [Candidatus Shapirobacteria bacterium]|jgi:large subunit ribosomal protein L3|nr:50S ribosomal protein L3 [Candidatus Shapirobacteria bacterium]